MCFGEVEWDIFVGGMLRGKLVEFEWQMFVCIRLVGVEYRLVDRVFHLSRTWVQKGLLNLRFRNTVLCVRMAMGGCPDLGGS